MGIGLSFAIAFFLIAIIFFLLQRILIRERLMIKRMAELDYALSWHKQEHEFARKVTGTLYAEEEAFPTQDVRAIHHPRKTRLLWDEPL